MKFDKLSTTVQLYDSLDRRLWPKFKLTHSGDKRKCDDVYQVPNDSTMATITLKLKADKAPQ